MALPLSPQVFAILSAFLAEKAGLHYGPADKDLLAEKVGSHATELGFESLLDFYYFLRYDDADGRALAALLEVLVVNETYFYREHHPLEQLVDLHLAPLIAAGKRPRVWSAASSTGEEPLTIAMILDERGLLDEVEIVASDLSERVLDKAREGRWTSRSVREGLTSPAVEKYLRRAPGGGWTIDPRIHRAVSWRRANLVHPETFADFGAFEAIVCRNVLIYFADPTASRVIASLAAHLVPGGWFLVGVSESLLRFGSELSCEEIGGAFVYRKVS